MTDLETMAIRHMYQTDPRMFMPLAFRLVYPGAEYLHNWSIDLLGDALAKCHRREITRLIINMPPRSLKSFCASVAFPAWVLGVDPTSSIMCVAGHRTLAEDQHVLAHRLMSNERYLGLFPHMRSTEKPAQLRLPQGGGRYALTPSTPITGRGANMVIIDDPHSTQDAENPQKLHEINRWYDRNIYQRLNDKDGGVVIVVMQRLAENDLTGHLLKRENWEMINLPAIAMHDEYLPESLGGKLARNKGEALHPAREDRDALRAEMLNMGSVAFMSQYQQKPYPPGQGEVRCGSFFFTTRGVQDAKGRSPYSMFLGKIPEEQYVLRDIFNEGSVPSGAPPYLETPEEWHGRARKIKRLSPAS
jgi:hypothetical protein